jgi:hypothetical protein
MRPEQTARPRSWLRRNKVAIFIGAPLLFFLLAPFPIGCGFIYEVEDELSGHPRRLHGDHPQNLVGLWVRDEYIEFDFTGQAFYLLSNGRFAGNPGMTIRQWHADGDRLFIDSVSLCGNGYVGNVTSVHTVEFLGPDQMLVAHVTNANAKRGIMGTYRRVELTDAYKEEMERLSKSEDEEQNFRGYRTLLAIQQYEVWSKLNR